MFDIMILDSPMSEFNEFVAASRECLRKMKGGIGVIRKISAYLKKLNTILSGTNHI